MDSVSCALLPLWIRWQGFLHGAAYLRGDHRDHRNLVTAGRAALQSSELCRDVVGSGPDGHVVDVADGVNEDMKPVGHVAKSLRTGAGGGEGSSQGSLRRID